MQAFEYASPATVDEAVGLLSGPEGQARPLAGGTDLLVQLRAERYALQRVVDVKAIPELNRAALQPLRWPHAGAAVPCYRIYEDPALLAAYPALVDFGVDSGRDRDSGPGQRGGQPLQRFAQAATRSPR